MVTPGIWLRIVDHAAERLAAFLTGDRRALTAAGAFVDAETATPVEAAAVALAYTQALERLAEALAEQAARRFAVDLVAELGVADEAAAFDPALVHALLATGAQLATTPPGDQAGAGLAN